MDNGHKSKKLSKINLSIAYFSTQGKGALPGKKKSKLKVLLMHVECCDLADYRSNTQTVIF